MMRIRKKAIALLFGPLWAPASLLAATTVVPIPAGIVGTTRAHIQHDGMGSKLIVDGKQTLLFGMNWAYMPIGENYTYSLWNEPEGFIAEALDREMKLLQALGVNVVRQYPGIPPRWVRTIYEQYGIYTVINPTVGRYGATIDGVWRPHTDYADAKTRAFLKQEVLDLVAQYKDTPGVLMWMLGNENNYGLHWTSFEIADLPVAARDARRAESLYSLFGEIINAIKEADDAHPVSIANGDLQYIDLIKKHCPRLDLLGTNVYRGASAGDLFEVVDKTLGVPVYFSEFGADAYDALRQSEDDVMQARYLKAQWQEIYQNSYGQRGAGNAVGGFVFQWSDGWWKHGQDYNLEVHDTTASWSNGGYFEDYRPDFDNMNEEWFGICAMTPRDASGHYALQPRTAYYLLRDAWKLDPYAQETTPERIDAHFAALATERSSPLRVPYAIERVEAAIEQLQAAQTVGVRMHMENTAAGPPDRRGEGKERLQVDHLESFFVDFRLRTPEAAKGYLSVNVLGNVPENRIDEIFYERRGRQLKLRGADGRSVLLQGNERVKVYQASFSWESPLLAVDGFYRTGHFHWGYEGDFFGLYREANDQAGVDRYNADAPFGVLLTGRGALDGVKVAMGPQLFWGANPTIIGKYRRRLLDADVTLMHQEDVARQYAVAATFVIPEQVSRKSTLHLERSFGGLKLEAGAIWAGTEKIGRRYVAAEKNSGGGGAGYLGSGWDVEDGEIALRDTVGGKGKVSLASGALHWYVQGSYQGLVADGGYDAAVTFTGWSLKESGRGNHYALSSGAAVGLGKLQVAPNLLYQRPLQGPLPSLGDQFRSDTDTYFAGVRPRNVLDDPFAVLENRETLGLELLLVFDPTPATWFWTWDNEAREDAPVAGSVDFVYRVQPTRRDVHFGFLADGTMYPFDASPPARDVWDVNARLIFNPNRSLRIASRLYGGRGQANGIAPRMVNRFGGDARVIWRQISLSAYARFNDWGPYDYHRDHNLTFPVQLMADLAFGVSAPRFGLPYTRFGIRSQLRYLDRHSPRYPYAKGSGALATEFEVSTYVDLVI